MHSKREVKVDLIKIFACIGVVALHTVKMNKGILNLVIGLLATTSIPLFFVINGYLMFRKDQISYKYAFRKIFRILIVCFSWEALHGLAFFLYYRESRNFLRSFILDFFQKGLFFHFWFMGALIILYLILPLLRKLQRELPVKYKKLLFVFGTVCVIVDIIMIVLQNPFILKVAQSLRIWIWIFYYMLGGYIAVNRRCLIEKINNISMFAKNIIFISTILGLLIWQLVIGKIVYGKVMIECNYGALPIIIATISIFLYSISLNKIKNDKRITKMASVTMGIYIFHPFILAVLEKFIPVFVEGKWWMNILFWMIVVFLSGAITMVVNCIPVLRQLIKL